MYNIENFIERKIAIKCTNEEEMAEFYQTCIANNLIWWNGKDINQYNNFYYMKELDAFSFVYISNQEFNYRFLKNSGIRLLVDELIKDDYKIIEFSKLGGK